MSKYLVTAPRELSTFEAQPPELGALIVHGPIAYGSEAVPEPLVTHAQLRKSASEVIVIAACGGGPAAGAPLVRIRARAASGMTLRSRRERSISSSLASERDIGFRGRGRSCHVTIPGARSRQAGPEQVGDGKPEGEPDPLQRRDARARPGQRNLADEALAQPGAFGHILQCPSSQMSDRRQPLSALDLGCTLVETFAQMFSTIIQLA